MEQPRKFQIFITGIYRILILTVYMLFIFESLGTSYWRRVIIRVPEEESTRETRFVACTKLATYLTNHPRNTYRTAFCVNPDTFDRTPEDLEERQALDNFLMDTDIVDHVKRFLELPAVENTWATVNSPIANHYFSGPIYPAVACEQLGYVNAVVVTPAMAPGINN